LSQPHSRKPIQFVEDRALAFVTLGYCDACPSSSLSKDSLKRVQNVPVRSSPFVNDEKVFQIGDSIAHVVTGAGDT